MKFILYFSKGQIIRSFSSHLPSLFILLFLLLSTRHLKLIIISLCPFLRSSLMRIKGEIHHLFGTQFHICICIPYEKITLNFKRLSWNSWVREKDGSVIGWSLPRGRIGRDQAAYSHRQKPTSGGKALKRTCSFSTLLQSLCSLFCKHYEIFAPYSSYT